VDNLWDARWSVAGACARAVSQRPLAVPPSADRSLRDGRAVWWRGPRAHTTIVHGGAMRHTAEAKPPRLLGHHKLAHRSSWYACLRRHPRTGPCSG